MSSREKSIEAEKSEVQPTEKKDKLVDAQKNTEGYSIQLSENQRKRFASLKKEWKKDSFDEVLDELLNLGKNKKNSSIPPSYKETKINNLVQTIIALMFILGIILAVTYILYTGEV